MSRKALDFADEVFPLFYRSLALSGYGEAAHQIYTSKACFLLRHLAHPSPNFYKGQKVRNLASIFDTTRL